MSDEATRIGLIDGQKTFAEAVEKAFSLGESAQSPLQAKNTINMQKSTPKLLATLGLEDLEVSDNKISFSLENLDAIEAALPEAKVQPGADEDPPVSGSEKILAGINALTSKVKTIGDGVAKNAEQIERLWDGDAEPPTRVKKEKDTSLPTHSDDALAAFNKETEEHAASGASSNFGI